MLGGDGRELELGDTVDVPGGMHGVIKFIGSVKGKKGMFAGVELSSEFASKGKNDGDVDGVRYFTTSRPGAGIFLPTHRASKRSSPSLTADTFPPTPTTPSFANFNLNGTDPEPTSIMPKFSQSVGPGARAPSPVLKPKRPSLPRPESPFRNKPTLAPTPGRGPSLGPASFSKSLSGASTPRYSPSPGIGKLGPKARTPTSSRPYSRNNSRLNNHTPISEDGENTTPTPASRTSDPTSNSTPRARAMSNDEEVKRLKTKLDDRDHQLKEQAASLADMETSLSELQSLIPDAGTPKLMRGNSFDNNSDAAQLRIMLREKNERIAMLTAEFDAHRADFRSTIDTLEMASTETERVYEKRIEELMQEVRDIQERGNDVDTVALQLKQLEELVQELEEGLEDARRGEAEARGEVEFLRGEVERGRSELKREREKAAAALKGANTAVDPSKRDSREVEQRDDEIRGLKAIIHSLSSGPDLASPRTEMPPLTRNATYPGPPSEEVASMQTNLERLEREKKELQGLIDRKTFREEELERELEKARGTPLDNRSSVISDKTATQEKRSSARDSKGTVLSWRNANSPGFHKRGKSSQMNIALEPMAESEVGSSIGEGSSATLWCEICETGGHDILSCTNISGTTGAATGAVQPPKAEETKEDGTSSAEKSINDLGAEKPEPLAMAQKTLPPPPTSLPPPTNPPTAPLPSAPSLPSPFDSNLVPGKGSMIANPVEWCAICERDGHLAMSCPFEDQF
ncbi:hypothetical protein NA57DRAFT_42376 [Rhizodiscina lignyota]|uniref:CAP-Gly domain-containing protein n=1 Tax=Rhizodiscina lignyota TaxID=1504668 RepID=A0A9P4IBD8_9PEZI|nr:hypothetical protein NA57DRAFT_42376 [Rhizodiscina lignyota]